MPPPAVHPRACGEHVARRSPVREQYGSSTRLRGTLLFQQHRALERRFIPAPAGNTIGTALVAFLNLVHPRACGEHLPEKLTSCVKSGSSPRLRGTLGISDRAGLPGRFIPAPAGNTPRRGDDLHKPAVHPRACGEHHQFGSCPSWFSGSSPRLRGTLTYPDAACGDDRFIPAPAGNTFQTFSYLGLSHGSSPRLRGTLQSYASDRQWKIPIAAIYGACRSVSPGWSGRGLAAVRCRAAGCRRHGGWWPGGWR